FQRREPQRGLPAKRSAERASIHGAFWRLPVPGQLPGTRVHARICASICGWGHEAAHILRQRPYLLPAPLLRRPYLGELEADATEQTAARTGIQSISAIEQFKLPSQ
ncbi:hypothetical protein PENTCL1PPCAC_21055, partial [Pristionchus entomophagus]